MKTYEVILDQAGNTPLVRLRTGIPSNDPKAYVKLEWYNPSGSVKDRAEGVSSGDSSRSVAVGIERVAAHCGQDDIIVGIFADAGIRYLSKWYNDEWMRRQGFLPSPKGA